MWKKHSEALKRIQNKHKISRLGPKIDRKIRQRNTMYIIEYCIMREGVPLNVQSIGNIITEEKEEVLSLISEEVEEDNLNFRVELAKLPDKEYRDNESSCREVCFMNDFDEYVDEDHIDDVLNKADEEVNTNIEEDQDKDSILGIQAFHFKLIIEYIYY